MLQVKHLSIGEGRPKICVPLTGRTHEQIVKQAQRASESAADIIEWRVDYFESFQAIEQVIRTLGEIRTILSEKILLFTFRTLDEGGESEISLKEYHNLNLTVAHSGKIDLLDLELSMVEYLGRSFVQVIKETHVKLIMSAHDFTKTPVDGDLVFRLNVMNQLGADIGKIATTPHSLQDVLRIMALVEKVRAFNHLPLALISMGDLGKVTRVGAELMGSVFTFASLDEASAPGQIPIEQMDSILSALRLKQV